MAFEAKRGMVWFDGCAKVPARITDEWNGYAVARVKARDVAKLFRGTGSSVRRSGQRIVIGDPDTGARAFRVRSGMVNLGNGWSLDWE